MARHLHGWRQQVAWLLSAATLLILLFTAPKAMAACPGCCSSHGGISSSCGTGGRILCKDGTTSPSCTCSSCGVSSGPSAPACTLSAFPASITAGSSSTLTASCSPTATSYTWLNGVIGSGSSSGLVFPAVTTTYTVKGTNSGGTGNTASATVTVTPLCTGGAVWNGTACACPAGQVLNAGLCVAIPAAPVCSLSASAPSVTLGQAVTLTATCSPAATSYQWTVAPFTGAASGGSVAPDKTTTYTVRGVNLGGTGGIASVTVTVTPACSGGRVWDGLACSCPVGQIFSDGQCFAPAPALTCGTERWAIKTGTDTGAPLVARQTVIPSSVAAMSGFVVPAGLNGPQRLSPVEFNSYVIDASLVEYRLAEDSDYHLVLKDAAGKTMIAKIPHLDCVGASSPFRSAIADARAAFNANLRALPDFKATSIPVRVYGVGYFDALRGQRGFAANGVELHPLLSIEFRPASTQQGSAAFPLESESTRLFKWAETVFPDLFPKPGTAGTYQNYVYRYYPATQTYVATSGGRVVLHNGREWNFYDVGGVLDFLPLAAAAGF